MIDFSDRDNLPKDEFGRIYIPLPEPVRAPMGTLLNSGIAHAYDGGAIDDDYNRILELLRADYYECCRDLLESRQYQRYGDDSGDYQYASASIAAWLQNNFGMALWHSELDEGMMTTLNAMLNCADEEHCIHQYAVDGPELNLERLAVDWESCPLMA